MKTHIVNHAPFPARLFLLVALFSCLFLLVSRGDDDGIAAEPRQVASDVTPIPEPAVPAVAQGVHDERPGDPYMPRPATPRRGAAVSSTPVVRGPYVSVQVNVDEFGNNIVGDAANEPSIAVDPTDPNRIVIGWRQFDTVESSFRQAGWAYSHDGGKTWTFPGVLEPGVFRSDPVLDSDAEGKFYYFSLRGDFSYWLFKSTDGGVSWDPPVFAFGGDKGWMTIDKTDGPGRGNIYTVWSSAFSCCGSRTLSRSTDGGLSFMEPVAPPVQPFWGTISVAPSGELYSAGFGGVIKWVNAWSPEETPVFKVAGRRFSVACAALFPCAPNPNPAGLPGQAWIATDHSTGPTRGNVYVLFPGNGLLLFWRSTDGGATWSDCIRINDDSLASSAEFVGEYWLG